MTPKIKKIETFVKENMPNVPAHDFKHVNRVRNHAIVIAKSENYQRLDLVEAAALLHDIGLSKQENNRQHGEKGAIIARDYLTIQELFKKEEIDEICNAIKYHNKNRDGSGKLLDIIRDADMIDLFGAFGVLRSVLFAFPKPDYDPKNPKGETWQLTSKDFDKRFDDGVGRGDYIVDYINFCSSCFGNLKTKSAKNIAKPLIAYMNNFILQLESEINTG